MTKGWTVAAAAVAVAITAGGRQDVTTGTSLYVDCALPRNGDGSVAHPFNGLPSANRVMLGPGSSLLLRRNTVCRGSLAPRGSGSSGRPIVIGSYGSGARPRIETDGTAPDAVRLLDESHVVLQDLDVTNHGNDRTTRRGIHVIGLRPGAARDITIRRVFVHDVEGTDAKGLGGSGGIQVDNPAGRVLIEGNRVQDVNRSGILVVGTGRAPRPPANRPWPSATTGVVIRGNTVERVGGDGIVPTGTQGAIVSRNVVCCANLRGRPGIEWNAGIWAFAANRTVIEHNVVHDVANARADGTGYDLDYDQDGTVIQSNVGYRNAGGFVLLCATGGSPRRAAIRFNLSVDEYALSEAPCGARAPSSDTLSGVRFYDNTLLTPTSRIWHDDSVAVATLPQAGGFRFTGNIVVATSSQSQPFPCGRHCARNVFWGFVDRRPGRP